MGRSVRDPLNLLTPVREQRRSLVTSFHEKLYCPVHRIKLFICRRARQVSACCNIQLFKFVKKLGQKLSLCGFRVHAYF